MPLILNKALPVYSLLQAECPEVLAEESGYSDREILHLLFFNLMSDKIGAELQYLRCLSASPLPVKVDFLRQISFTSPRQDAAYLERFYLTEADILHRHYDGMLITGAPLEHISCEDTLYWEEFCRILDWSKTHCGPVISSCWGAYSGLYHDFGIAKTDRPRKLSGIFDLEVYAPDEPLFRGIACPMCVPISRATDMDQDAAADCPEVVLLASARDVATPVYLKTRDNRRFYVTAHPEYERERLAFEYARDSAKNKDWNIQVPRNYFPQDDPTKEPQDRWVQSGKRLFCNWLEFYVAGQRQI